MFWIVEDLWYGSLFLTSLIFILFQMYGKGYWRYDSIVPFGNYFFTNIEPITTYS